MNTKFVIFAVVLTLMSYAAVVRTDSLPAHSAESIFMIMLAGGLGVLAVISGIVSTISESTNSEE